MVNFTTGDYPTFTDLAAQNANAEQVDFRLDDDINGELITGFDNVLRIYTENDSKIIGDLTFNTITEAILEGVHAQNVSGNVHIVDCVANTVDGFIDPYPNSWINSDGSINCNGIVYCDQPIPCGE